MSGLPEEHQARRVKIFQPAPRNTHFARPRAPAERKKWTLEYDKASSKAGKWVNPLMVRRPLSPPPPRLPPVKFVSISGKSVCLHICARWGAALTLLLARHADRAGRQRRTRSPT